MFIPTIILPDSLISCMLKHIFGVFTQDILAMARCVPGLGLVSQRFVRATNSLDL